MDKQYQYRGCFCWFIFIISFIWIMYTAETIYGMENQIHLFVDGDELVFTEAEPVLINGNTMVPVRGVFEHMGFDVYWDSGLATAILLKDGDIVLLKSRALFFLVNGRQTVPEVLPQIIGGRFYLPLRAVGEACGAEVSWDGITRTININMEAKEGIGQVMPTVSPEILSVKPLFYEPFLHPELMTEISVQTNKGVEKIQLEIDGRLFEASQEYPLAVDDETLDWIIGFSTHSLGEKKGVITAIGWNGEQKSTAVEFEVVQKSAANGPQVYAIRPGAVEIHPGDRPVLDIVTNDETVKVLVEVDGFVYTPFIYTEEQVEGQINRHWQLTHATATTPGEHEAKVQAEDSRGDKAFGTFIVNVKESKETAQEGMIHSYAQQDLDFKPNKRNTLYIYTDENIERVSIEIDGAVISANYIKSDFYSDGRSFKQWEVAITIPNAGDNTIKVNAWDSETMIYNQFYNIKVEN